jgi:hypothetical protein
MIYKFLLFLLTISELACAQTNQKSYSKPFSYIDSLINKNNYTIKFLDFEYPKDIQEILLRFQKTMSEKKEWYQDYFSKNYKAGEGLPYHENFGITKDEYQRIKDLDKSPPILVIKDSASIKVNRASDILSFEATEERAKFMESVKIDFKNELLVFRNDTIPFPNEINAPATTPFGKWHGYSWKKEISNLGEKDDLKIDSLISKIIDVSFGNVLSNNKILFRLKYKEVDRGTIKANFEVLCYFN